jgi:phosphate transport system protein
MVLEFFKGNTQSGIEAIQATIVGMLRDGHDVFMAATDALFGGGKSKATKREVRSTDKDINAAQRDVRRVLMVHAAVNDADLLLVLQYASIVKDAERIGDYAKNIYDLVRYGTNFDASDESEELERYRYAVAQLILDAANAFEATDAQEAQRLIGKADQFLSDYEVDPNPSFRIRDLGFVSVPSGLESLRMTIPSG